jgi:two-component system chemotaxis sensor kinase CheA
VDQTQREFLVEIEELVEQIFADLDELRPTSTSGPVRRELIDRIFRRVHSVKGSAASCGLEVVRQIAHEFENLLDEVRAGRVFIDEVVVDTCENATEALSESLNLAASGIVEPSRRALFDRLQAAAQRSTNPPAGNETDAEVVLKQVPFEIWQALTEAEKSRLISVVAAGSPLFVVTAGFDIGDFDSQFFRLKERLAKLGEVVSTSPAVDEEQPERINFRVLFASAADRAAIETSVKEFSHVILKEVAGFGNEAANEPEPSDEAAEAPSSTLSDSASRASLTSLAKFVRADLDKIDRLISATHDLLRTTATALELATSQPLSNPVHAELHKLREQIRSSFMGVEDDLINLRLASLGPTLQRVARAGRAAARLAGKEIDFEINGAEILLDKLLVEAIADPLIHLVRNAVDHGIETGDERAAAGKSRRGVVRIEAVSEGSQSRLRVVDDGRGVDPAVIAAAAVRLGIHLSDLPLDIDRSLRLIFRPGFTTLASATEVSGRGVGLDVVETAVEQVGGELRVSSEPGRGTTFEIRLPVTFGLVPANVVVSAGSRYCIPAGQTLGIDAIDVVDGSSGANRLLQVSLRDLLGQPDEPENPEALASQLHLITCQFTDAGAGIGSQKLKCVGIVVDRVEGPQEVLVRTLGRHAGRWYGIAGATELRDGTVALVLDLPRLLSSL